MKKSFGIQSTESTITTTVARVFTRQHDVYEGCTSFHEDFPSFLRCFTIVSRSPSTAHYSSMGVLRVFTKVIEFFRYATDFS